MRIGTTDDLEDAHTRSMFPICSYAIYPRPGHGCQSEGEGIWMELVWYWASSRLTLAVNSFH
jgi:hypothetical protein